MQRKAFYKRLVNILTAVSIITAIAIIILAYKMINRNSNINSTILSYSIVPSESPGFYPESMAIVFNIQDSKGNIVHNNKNIEIIYTITNHKSRTPLKVKFQAPTGEKYFFSRRKEPHMKI